jgi:signal peptidase
MNSIAPSRAEEISINELFGEERPGGSQDTLPGMPETPAPRPARSKRRVFSAILTWLVTLVLVGLLGIGVAVGLLPAMHNGKPLTILSGSMEPTFHPGDLVIVYGEDSFENLRIGDIITFMPNPNDPTLVTHRLVGWTTDPGGEKMAITKGDANNSSDNPIYQKQLRAVYQYRIPKLGYVLSWGADQFSKPRVLVIAAGVLILYSLVMLVSTSFRKRPATASQHKSAR